MFRVLVALSIIFVYSVQGFTTNPQVNNIRAHQLENSFTVEILYDLIDPDPNLLTVSVEILKDDDSSFSIFPEHLTGDIGERIEPGINKAIYWDAGTDLPGVFGTDYRAKIIVNESIQNPGSGDVDLNEFRWKLVSTTGPSPRSKPLMVYNSDQNETILFGGLTTENNESFTLGDTWSWDGIRWTLKNINGPHRNSAGISYSTTTKLTYLFGGQKIDTNPSSSEILSDMWFWDGSKWTEFFLSPPNNPEARLHIFMASKPGEIVMHGGTNTTISKSNFFGLTGTWSFRFAIDSTGWEKVVNNGPVISTSQISSIGNMVYHPVEQKMVFFNSIESVIHTYNGTVWETIEIPPLLQPDGTKFDVRNYRLVYFPPTQSILVHGGLTSDNQSRRTYFNRLWELTDLNRLTPLLIDGPNVSHHEIIYDSEREQIVLFGGRTSIDSPNPSAFKELGETWVFSK